jgi:hypothetical protein
MHKKEMRLVKKEVGKMILEVHQREKRVCILKNLLELNHQNLQVEE